MQRAIVAAKGASSYALLGNSIVGFNLRNTIYHCGGLRSLLKFYEAKWETKCETPPLTVVEPPIPEPDNSNTNGEISGRNVV